MGGLKPCPFCGSKATVHRDGQINCSNIECKLWCLFWSPDAWNTRAPSLALREVRGKVEKRIDEVGAGDGYGNTGSVRLFELDLFLSMLKELEGKI